MPRERFAPPDGLDHASRGVWRRTRDALVGQDTWRPVDVVTLERYVRVLERARHARERLEAAGEYTTRGSLGQLVQHPDVKTMREAERDAHEYAAALLATPAARARHSVTTREPGGGRLAAILSSTRPDAA